MSSLNRRRGLPLHRMQNEGYDKMACGLQSKPSEDEYISVLKIEGKISSFVILALMVLLMVLLNE